MQNESIFKSKRHETRMAAKAFARICAEDEDYARRLYDAAHWLNECGDDAWRLAMGWVGKLPRVSRGIQDAFQMIWIENKMLPGRIGHRRMLAKALRVLMPGYTGESVTLYRGTKASERRRHTYGFSWTKNIEIARNFAENWVHPESGIEGILLKTCAPQEAILLMRQREDDGYDEDEVVVDPFQLGEVAVIERLSIPRVTGLA